MKPMQEQRWSQASHVLHELRQSAVELEDTIFMKAVSDVDSNVFAESGSGKFSVDQWQDSFEEQGKELDQLVSLVST